ncbi:MAG TPA: hypothetical protein VKQ11_00640 [Candidatus Sulfotelmatobacter sp.]|nr:hypothetical protein [Candidatus Sulfotelmatobacter sp.]
MTPELKKKLRLQGIDKRARGAFFNGRRKDVSGANFSEHGCYLCPNTFPCELGENCDHAVYVRICPTCDPEAGKRKR